MSLFGALLLLAGLMVLILGDHLAYWLGDHWRRWGRWSPVLAGTLVALGLACMVPAHADGTHDADHTPRISRAAKAWRPTLTREARAVWGLSAPVSLFGAQIQQESAWQPGAHSAYADGLAQFTPGTARTMARWYPRLGAAAPLDPHWAMRAMVRYDWRLYTHIDDTASACDHWAMTLSSYNGGRGWLMRDRRLCRQAADCDAARWWGNVAGHTNRADWARKENRDYPVRILRYWQPAYVAAGWPGPAVCP